jgi:hypothetical protein
MQRQLIVCAASLIVSFVWSASLACGQTASGRGSLPSARAWQSDREHMRPGMVAVGSEEGDAPTDTPFTGAATMHGNCTVWSQGEQRHRISVPSSVSRSAKNGHLHLAKRRRPRTLLSHHAPLISFRCGFDAPDSGLEAAP